MSGNTETVFVEPWVEDISPPASLLTQIETPFYLVSLEKLETNLKILQELERDTGIKVLAALKSFSMFSLFPLMASHLSGSEASSVNEARLAFEEFGNEVHVFSPSYSDRNIQEYIKYADHMVFNSLTQLKKFKKIIDKSDKSISCGIRINPEVSLVDNPKYDPSHPCSHFGIMHGELSVKDFDGIDGLHFHNLCEMDVDALKETLASVESKFGKYLKLLKWINFGGGHHITKKGYEIDQLRDVIREFRERNPNLDIYIEPGEAIAINAGIFVAQVVDIFPRKNTLIAVLDASATAHMPDVLEMPYLPTIVGAIPAHLRSQNRYRVVGSSCLTGDVFGDYSFDDPIEIGDRVVFLNMAIYTMVKNNTFNGINLPSIATIDKNNFVNIVKKFDYLDFKNRLS